MENPTILSNIKDIVKLIKEVGLESVINAVIILLGVKYFIKKMDDKKCIQTPEMRELNKNISDLKSEVRGVKGLIEGFIAIFRYRGKNDD